MKYLVNRETKEHKIYEGGPYSEVCDIVDADDEGWIKWFPDHATLCPMPKSGFVEVLFKSGVRVGPCDVGGFIWHTVASQSGPKDIEFYRPILPAESKPTLEETWEEIKTEAKVDVFARLSAAVAASESIPALIAEINALLPEGYSVTQTAQVMAEPETHDSWDEQKEVNGFRVGDFVECISDRDSADLLKVGTIYRVRKIQNRELVFDENDCSWMTSRFNLHSRPVTK